MTNEEFKLWWDLTEKAIAIPNAAYGEFMVIFINTKLKERNERHDSGSAA